MKYFYQMKALWLGSICHPQIHSLPSFAHSVSQEPDLRRLALLPVGFITGWLSSLGNRQESAEFSALSLLHYIFAAAMVTYTYHLVAPGGSDSLGSSQQFFHLSTILGVIKAVYSCQSLAVPTISCLYFTCPCLSKLFH